MEKIILNIEGMHCTGCSDRLEKVINSNENLNGNVDFESKVAHIEYDNEKITLDEIKEIIEDAGFEAK